MTHRYASAFTLLVLLLAPAAQAQAPKNISPTIERAAQIVYSSRVPPPTVQAGKATGAGINLTEVQIEVDDWLEWRLSGKTVYTYEAGLRTQEEQSTALEDGSWEAATRTLFAHENHGELRYATEIQTWNGAIGAYEPETRFQIDWVCFVFTTGRCAFHRQTEQHWDGATWVNVERSTYAYHNFEPLADDHPIKSHTVEAWVDGAWVPMEKYSFVEHYPGTYVETWMTRQTWDGSTWEDAERTVYYYLMLFQVQQRLAEIWEELLDYGGLLLPLQLPDHNLLLWEDQTWKQQVRQRTIITQEGDRRVRYEATTEQYEDAWSIAAKLTIDYDDNGLPSILVAEGMLDEDEDDLPGVLFERYFWNEAGKLAGARQGIIVTGNEIPFTRYTFAWTNEGAVNTETLPQTVSFALDPAYPNPFNGSTILPYRMETNGALAIKVFDALGREVATLFDGHQSAGVHVAALEAADLPSGIYIIRVQTRGQVQSRKVVLQR